MHKRRSHRLDLEYHSKFSFSWSVAAAIEVVVVVMKSEVKCWLCLMGYVLLGGMLLLMLRLLRCRGIILATNLL